MKRPGFPEGFLLAILLCIAGFIIFECVNLIMNSRIALQFTLTVTSLGYLVYLLKRSGVRTGRLTVIVLWTVITTALWLMQIPLSVFLIGQVVIIWLVRSLYYYASVLSSLVDLMLTGTGLLVAFWAIINTNNLFFSLCSFYLIQSLFVTIPEDWKKPGESKYSMAISDDKFERAYHCAEAAIRKFSSSR